MQNILVLTSVYPGNDLPETETPVVHYFAKEWVKMGYNVKVIHYVANFPTLLYKLAKPFKDIIGSRVGFGIKTTLYKDCEYSLDGVAIKRIAIKKLRPHALYPNKEVYHAFNKTLEFCKSNKFNPNVIISHWPNPMLDIMGKLKQIYNVPLCYIAHNANEVNVYKGRTKDILNNLNIIGFRSDAIRRQFMAQYPLNIPHFQCNSGIPEKYINTECVKDLNEIKRFIYIGTLINRKFPNVIINALKIAYNKEKFEMTYIGSGNESKKIINVAHKFNVFDNIKLLGRISRDEVIKQLDEAQVFVMISRNETYGLVYLEAMARGCLTIASRNEGFDGIIKDNVNGFLCKAGDYKELAQIITKIRNMSKEERFKISNNAIETAKQLTDKKAAQTYINNVLNIS